MAKKNKQHCPHVDKKLQRTFVRLLRPIAGRPQTPVGAEISVKRLATDRFRVLGQEVRQVEVQPDGTVGLLLEGGVVIISADDYDRILDLQLPGGHWPRRRGRLPQRPGTSLISTEDAAQLLGVSPRKVRDWLYDGVLTAADTFENRYGQTCYLLDAAIIGSPATRALLAEQIADYQRHRDARRTAALQRPSAQPSAAETTSTATTPPG